VGFFFFGWLVWVDGGLGWFWRGSGLGTSYRRERVRLKTLATSDAKGSLLTAEKDLMRDTGVGRGKV